MDSFREMLGAISRNECTDTDLSAKNLTVDAARELAEALKNNTSLVTLNLEHNNIGDEGALLIADALRTNTTLKVFKFAYNNTSSLGENALEDAIIESNSTNITHATIGEDDALNEGLRMILSRNIKSLSAPSLSHCEAVIESKANALVNVRA